MPKVRGNAAAKQAEEATDAERKESSEGKKGHEGTPQNEGLNGLLPGPEANTTRDGGDDVTGDTVHAERKEEVTPEDEPMGNKDDEADEADGKAVPMGKKDDEADDAVEKAVTQEEREVDQEEDDEAANAPKAKRVKRARAGTNDYWVEVARESGVSVPTVKKVHEGIRKFASRQLQSEEMSGPFELQSIARFTVRQVQHRAYKKQVYGKQVNVSEIKPQRKIFVKSMLGVQGLAE